jgi:polar amino acid transport system permease protein
MISPSGLPAQPAVSTGRRRRDGGRSILIAVVSTLVFFSVIGWVIVSSPSWPLVQHDFFDAEVFWRYLPVIGSAFVTNIALFLIAEVLVLILGLFIAVLRSLPGPVFFPVRLVAIAYADIFRGVPSLLIIYVLGFGIAGLGIPGVPNDPFFWAAVSLTLVYTAYVSEVYRAGIESIHPSQAAAARSLGLTQAQALRYVVIPQAVRRVIPPLLNDFIGLQKDTVLVSYLGLVEAFRTANIEQQSIFNYTPYLALSVIFLVITLPLTRLTDYLVARDRRRFLAGAR